MQQLMLQAQGITNEKRKVKVVLSWADDCPGDTSGLDLAPYCEGTQTEKTATVTQCLTEAFRQVNRYTNKVADEAEMRSLACEITGAYPEKAASWEDPALNDSLHSLVAKHLSN